MAVALLALGASTGRARTALTCAPRLASPGYTASVEQAVASNSDLWGAQLLRAPGGPTLAGARRFLAPLNGAVQWGGPLTASGSYYLAFSFPFTSYGSTVYALHVADGSEIITRRVEGASLTVYVGDGKERYGSCVSRLRPARLAEGYLPILQTSYTDAGGVRYRQESFVGRAYGKKYGARSVISFVRLDVDARHASRGATVRLVPWRLLTHSAPDRLALDGKARLIVSDGATFAGGVVRYRVPRGGTQTIYAAWLNAPSDARYVHANETVYDKALSTVETFWQARLDQGATFDVPDEPVQDAERGILTQLISFGWRYSIGNPYEELSYAESLDAAELAAEYGFPSVAKSIIELSLQRMRVRPWRFTAFRAGHILLTAALYYRVTHDRVFVHRQSAALARLVDRIAGRQQPSGRLAPEALSTDLEHSPVDSVSGQIEAVEGLLAIGRAWSSTGHPVFAARARTLGLSIDTALRTAVERGSTRLPDGSLFIPDQLPQRPFQRITATRDGSYWNLVMPYAFSSGWFPAHSETSRRILEYLMWHGGRLLGVPRTYARTVYGDAPGAGLAPVYGLGISRFLADNDQPDQLDVSLYGMLAAGMTAGTYVSGEAVSLLPLNGAYDRAMFMPPNSGANASYLETLRELLIHERRGASGAPTGLDLAFSTPRDWLADGQEINVRDAPTSFGNVTYSLVRSGSRIDGEFVLPPHSHARLRLRLPPGERLVRVLVGRTRVAAGRAGTIDLGSRRGTFELQATVR